MNQNESDACDALCREKLFYFVWGAFKVLYPGQKFHPAKHMELLCYTLEQVVSNPGKNLLVTMPPRYAKTFIISICFVAWQMGKDPTTKFLVASYGEGLAADQADLFKKLVESAWYKRLFPSMKINPKRSRPTDIQTTQGGRRKAISAGGEATGFGADIVIIDDIIKAQDAQSDVERQNKKNYFDQTLLSRINNKKLGHVIANQQRFHEDDPAAYLLTKDFDELCLRAIAEDDERWVIDNQVWERKRGEALYPELEDLKTLENIKKRVTAPVFSAQYQQNPVNPGGNQISWNKISFYPKILPRTEYIWVVQTWDTACSANPDSDYSACATIGYTKAKKWHLLEIHRGQYEYTNLRQNADYMIQKWRPDRVIIERASTGISLVSDLNEMFPAGRQSSLYSMMIHSMSHSTDKETRVYLNKDWLEEGRILLPESASWLPDFRRELLAFPSGLHDDQVDALFLAFEYLETPRGKSFVNRDPLTGRTRTNRRRRY